MKKVYTACFYPEEGGGYCVLFPDLPGAVTYGDTLEDAMEMAVDCAGGWLLGEMEQGRKLPAPAPFDEVQTDEYPDGFKNRILIDLDALERRQGRKAVKKTLTIPAYLNTAAEREGINFSQVLRQALEERLGA